MKINRPQIFYNKFIVSAKNIVDFSRLPRRNIMNDWYEKDKAFYPVEISLFQFIFGVGTKIIISVKHRIRCYTYLSIPTPT